MKIDKVSPRTCTEDTKERVDMNYSCDWPVDTLTKVQQEHGANYTV